MTARERLAQWLADNECSQAEFARQIGCSKQMVSRLLSDQRPGLDLAVRIERRTKIRAASWME